MNTKTIFFAALAAASLSFSFIRAEEPASQPAAPPIVAPPYATGDIQIVSPRGLHVAAVTMQGSRQVVMIDGKAGAPYDAILRSAADVKDVFGALGEVLSRTVVTSEVAFSDDGTRYAYAARLGQDIIVIVDGQELFRTAFSPARPAIEYLRFSPGGKHVYFLTPTDDTMASTRLVMDGKPQPPTQHGAFPVFSIDDDHYAYNATEPRGDKPFLVIDGAVAPYTGSGTQYTASGKLVTYVHADARDMVQLDGKPVIIGKLIRQFAVSPADDQIAAIVDDGKTQSLSIDGQAIADTEGAAKFIFSPDGKHWALQCVQSPNAWMILDGKKGQSYSGVGEPVYTIDSSKVLYVADAANKHFVVVNGQEEAGGVYVRVQPKIVGTHYAYVIGDNLGAMSVVYDGKIAPPGPDVMDVILSPDGGRYGYFAKGGITDYSIVIDGETQPATGGDYRAILFSPGNKHYATIASPPKGNKTLMIDGRFVPIVNNVQPGEPLFFTPDGEHLFTRRNEPMASGAGIIGIYMDGKPVAQFDGYSRNWPKTVMWDFAADDTITLIGGVPSGNKPGPVQRVTINPAKAETNVATIITGAMSEQAALDRAMADTNAAKAKAAANAKAARDQAAADAAAEKAQARADNAAAKAKARADAAAARAALKKKAAQQ